MKKVKKIINSLSLAAFTTITFPLCAYAETPVIKIDGMNNVASTLQNFVKYLGMFFIAGGVVTFAFGAYKLFNSIKSQDSESRSTAILEIAAGLGAIAVGTGCATFSGYISL